MKKQLRGFTFIELLTVMALIGVIAVMAVPRYIDAAQQAKDDTLWAHSIAVKNAHDAVTNRNEQPTVTNLTAEISAATAVANGVQIPISGVMYIVPTYSNALCTKPTKNVADPVRCVGAIAG
ncbi:MAG: type II secretion system GspH family protein [Gammaproteobacteria bacterium]|nr:type II secretion system GspH family protein [Gammaproteobacteria bacterium]